jgi:hypothetical protein
MEAEVVTAGAAVQEERENGNQGGKGKDYMVGMNPP